MKVALVYLPIFLTDVMFDKHISALHLGSDVRHPHLGLLYLASSLKKNGHSVAFIDANALNLTEDGIIKTLIPFKPDLLGFTLTTVEFPHQIEMISNVKKKLNCMVVVGGPHLSLYPEATLSFDSLDFGIMGDGEIALLKLVNSIENKSSFESIDGLIWKKDNNIVINSPPNIIEDLDNLLFPAREMLNPKLYYSILFKKRNATTMISGRGCPSNCTFCFEVKKVRLRTASNVIEEIEECIKKYDIKEFYFHDSTITVDRERIINICEGLMKKKLDVNWAIRPIPETLDKELISILKKSGCYRLSCGFESADPKIIKRLGKEHSLETITNIMKWSKEVGMEVYGYFMIGNPGDTPQTIEKTINLPVKLNMDYAQFTRLTIFPGTSLYEELKRKNKKDFWLDYMFNKIKASEIEGLDLNLSIQELNNYVNKAHKIFYLRTSFILKQIFKINSFSKLLMLIKTFFSIIH